MAPVVGSPVPPNFRAFGKYTLLTKLATGGMAEIFLAKVKAPGGKERFVCIKRILPHLAEEERFISMFLDEARIAAQIKHPNVCQVFELGQVDFKYFIAMEYLQGAPLSELIKRAARAGERLPAPLVVGIIRQACVGLHHAHNLENLDGTPARLVHRDVSPQNIFVTEEGKVKLLDFGIAKAQGASTKTRTGTVKGKYAYMSPEQLRGEMLDRRSDIWSLGVVTHEALVGRRLFHRETDFLIFQAITDDSIPRVADLRPDVPPGVSDVVARALSRNREDRFPSARDFAEAMSAAMASVEEPFAPRQISREVHRWFGEEIRAQRQMLAESSDDPEELLELWKTPVVQFERPPSGGGAAPQADSFAESDTPASGGGLPLPAPERTNPEGQAAGYVPPAASYPSSESAPRPGPAPRAQPAPAPEVTNLRPGSMSAMLWVLPVVILGVAVALFVTIQGGSSGDKTAKAAVAAPPEPAVEPAEIPEPVVEPDEPEPVSPAPVDEGAPEPAAITGEAPPDAAAAEADPVESEPPQDNNARDEAEKQKVRSPDKGRRAALRKDRRDRRPPPPPPRDEPQEPGTFTIDSNPYATIYIDGKKVGVTPLFRYELPPGRHRVKAVTSDGQTQSFVIKVEPGKEVPPRRLTW